jgi:hypothetical protein
MKPHELRVITEKSELDVKKLALAQFICNNPTYRTLRPEERSRLNRQLEAMALYSNILGERIAAFTP